MDDVIAASFSGASSWGLSYLQSPDVAHLPKKSAPGPTRFSRRNAGLEHFHIKCGVPQVGRTPGPRADPLVRRWHRITKNALRAVRRLAQSCQRPRACSHKQAPSIANAP